MGIENSDFNIEKVNKIFVDKFVDYLDLMKVAGCTDEELSDKSRIMVEFSDLSVEEKVSVIKDDMTFLDFFTDGGIVNVDDTKGMLYYGINKGIANSIVCTMSSIKSSTMFSPEYEEELEKPISLPKIKDMIGKDISLIIPDSKQLFFKGDKNGFHNRMTRIMSSEEIEEFSDLVDASVIRGGEAGIYRYMDLVDNLIEKAKEMDFTSKNKNL